MAGLVPAIHDLLGKKKEDVDALKSGLPDFYNHNIGKSGKPGLP